MPPAKGKAGKSKVEGLDAAEAREVLQLLDVGAAPPAETLQKVFRLNLGPCHASCGKGSKGARDNPCCFHGLLPAEGGFRKKGLWQKEPVLGRLGHDPAEDRRMAPSAPAGLRNLGNTCYVNAAMQFLHSLPAFRNALYQLEPELAGQDIIRQMRDLFIEMHFGPKRYVDPEPFANSLLLDHAIQQDGQEFLKLLLSKLEVVFAASQREDVTTVVQSLFQGHLSHVTTCHTCRLPSEGSKREVEFYELSLQVQQMPSLQHSLAAALAPDELVGDNQYFCDVCGAKSDADRRMRLRTLPPYLCLALQRFTYDQQTWEKKKVLHKLSIPLQLDMGAVLMHSGLELPDNAPLGPDRQPVLPGSPNSMYELAAVLIHKGTSASHGHYVAHIKLHDTGTWWRFDDEEAVEMGLQPTSHPADHGTTAATATAAASAGTSTAAGSAADADEDSKPAEGGKKRGKGGAAGATASKRGRRGAGRGSRGGGRKGKKGGKKEPWEEDSEADAEAEAATAAAEAAAEQDAQLQQALQMSLLTAHEDGSVMMSEAELNATVAAAAEAAAEAAAHGTSSRSTRRAGPMPATRGRGRGRGRGRAKAAEEPAEAAAAATAEPAGAEAAGAEAAAVESAYAAAGGEEQAAGLPQALVDHIMSANAYFLVYRQCPAGSQQSQAAAEAVAAPAGQPAAAATAQAAADAPQQAAAQVSVKQDDSAQQQPSQPQPLSQPLQALDQNQQPAAQPAAVSVKQEASTHQAGVPQQQQQQQQLGDLEGVSEQQQQQQPLAAQQLQAQLQELPDAVQQQVAQLHRDFDDACHKFQQHKQEALAAVEQRQQEVRTVSELLPAPPGCMDGCFIGLEWLDSWVNGVDPPGPLDNTVLWCEHSQLHPSLPTGTTKYIRDAAWQQLTALHKGGPRLSCSDACRQCLRALLQGLVSTDDLSSLRDELLAALEADADEKQQERLLDAPTSYYVSRTWVTGFKRRASGSSGRLEPPTAGIACPHGQLAPEGRSGAAKRFAVSRSTWMLLRQLWPQQVLWDVQARRDKERQKAKRAAAGGDAAAVADAVKDDEVEILDSPKKDKQQHQHQEQEQPLVTAADGDVTMIDADTDAEQQEQQQPDGAPADRASSPGAAADAAAAAAPGSWQLPFKLDGSEQLTQQQLLDVLPEFQVVNAYVCQECSAHLQEATAGHQGLKQQLEGQRQVLSKLLASTVTEALEQGVTYYLVPNTWLDTWRKHLTAALSRKLVVPAQLPPAPEPLPHAIRALMCSCHPHEQPLLAVPLPEVVNKRGRFSQADPQKDALRVITEHDWQHLLLYYSGLEPGAAAAAGAPAATSNAAHEQHTAAEQQQPQQRRRRSARAAAQEQERDPQEQQQEQHEVLLQLIASMADADPSYRGIRAWLKVAAPEPQAPQHTQQHEQQHTQRQEEQQQQQDGSHLEALQGTGEQGQAAQQQAAQQQAAQQAAGDGGHGGPAEEHEQQQQPLANGISLAKQRSASSDLGQGQQQEPQQQQPSPEQHMQVDTAPVEHPPAVTAATVAGAGAPNTACNPLEEALDLTGSPCVQRSKRQKTAVLDLSCSPAAPPPAADADVIVVESVDLAHEQLPQQAAAIRAAAEATGTDDEVLISQVIEASANGNAQQNGTAGRASKRQRQLTQKGASARRDHTVASAAAALRRPTSRIASAGAAAAVRAEAAAMSDFEDDDSGTEALAVAAAASASALRGWLETEPGPCEATLQAAAAERRAATLVYVDAELMVELITEDELQAAFSAAGAGERRSRRARKNRQPVKACSTDTLAMLRLKVFQSLSVHPRNQRLYVRGELLEGEDFTLAKLEVFPDEEIRLVNANQVPDDDYASVFDGVAGKRKAREVEIGFKDTALHGPTPPAAAAAAAAPEGDAAPSGCETGRASTPEQSEPQQQEQQP